jgi:hypothetical protein
MNLKARVFIETQKKEAQARLEARLALLKQRGLEPAAIQRDAAFRKIKAEIRKADVRLASIAAQHKLNQDRAQAKIEKLAAEKAAKEEPKKAAEPVPGKKEKKPKKAKPEGQEGQAKPKKEKKEPKEKGKEKGQEKQEESTT